MNELYLLVYEMGIHHIDIEVSYGDFASYK